LRLQDFKSFAHYMLFIRFVLSWSFVRKNQRMLIRLRKLFLPCFMRIEYCNSIIGLINTLSILNLSTHLLRLRNMMSF
jgi:hypothetical protein